MFDQPVMNQEVSDRRQIEMDLRQAIEQNGLHLEYQPIIDLRRNVVVGFETLARWQHTTRGAISPADFIPIAEDGGLILPLGEWALREACRQAARWTNELKIAVNLSPAQFSWPISPISCSAFSPKRVLHRNVWFSKSRNDCLFPISKRL